MSTIPLSLFKSLCLLIILILSYPVQAQKTAFTAEDVLNVKSFRMSAVSDDGKYLAGTIGTTRDRMGTDHTRFGDPNYVSPRKSEVVILNTKNGNFIPVFAEKQILRAMRWSPDNKRLAIIYYDGDKYKIGLYDTGRNRLDEVELNTDKDLSSSILEWTPEGDHLLISMREKGWAEKADSMYAEATEGPITVYDSKRPFLKWDGISNHSSLNIIARVNIKSDSVKEILPEGIYSNIRISENGSLLSFQQAFPLKTTYNRKDGSEYSLMSIDWQIPEDQDTLIKKQKDRIRANWNKTKDYYAYADSGKILIRSIFEKDAVRISRDTTEIVKKDTSKVKFSVIRWSPDSKYVLGSSKKGYWLIDIENKTQKLVYEFPEDKDKAPDLSIVDWSPDGRYWYMTYSAKDKWERGLVKYDLEAGEMKELVKDENLYSGWRLTEDGNHLLYSYSDGDHPTNLFICDPDFSSKKQLTDLNPWIESKKLTKSELVKYRDADGKELHGVLYYPVDYEDGKTYPLVCEIYESFFNNGFNSTMNLVANQGWFGFRPSVNLIRGYPGEAWIKGVTSGINKLIDRGLVDPDKLGVHGTSYGGYAASLLITQTDRFKAAINISGKVNIISFLGDSPKIGTRNYAAAEVGQDRIGQSLWEAPMKYFATSAVLYADRIKTPHMILTGEGDWNVPGTNSRELYYAMRRLGKEVIWVNYVRGGHGAGRASVESDYFDQVDRMMDFYRTNFEKEEE